MVMDEQIELYEVLFEEESKSRFLLAILKVKRRQDSNKKKKNIEARESRIVSYIFYFPLSITSNLYAMLVFLWKAFDRLTKRNQTT